MQRDDHHPERSDRLRPSIDTTAGGEDIHTTHSATPSHYPSEERHDGLLLDDNSLYRLNSEYEGILISWDGKGVSTREYDGPAGFPDEPRDTNTSVSNTGDTALIISWKGEAVPSDHYTGPIDFQPDLLENKSSRLPTAASDNDLERHRVESPFDLDLDVLSPPQEPAHGEEAGAETPPQRTAAEFMETRIERSSLDDGDFVLDEDEEEPCTSEMSTTEPSGLGAMSGGWKGRLRPYHSGSKHSAKPESGSKCV